MLFGGPVVSLPNSLKTTNALFRISEERLELSLQNRAFHLQTTSVYISVELDYGWLGIHLVGTGTRASKCKVLTPLGHIKLADVN